MCKVLLTHTAYCTSLIAAIKTYRRPCPLQTPTAHPRLNPKHFLQFFFSFSYFMVLSFGRRIELPLSLSQSRKVTELRGINVPLLNSPEEKYDFDMEFIGQMKLRKLYLKFLRFQTVFCTESSRIKIICLI